MIKSRSAVVIAFLATLMAIALSATSHAATNGPAPADEYFGTMKLSYLGINNSLKDASIMAGDHTTFQVVISKIQWAENALLDWQKKYPNDPQIARSLFLLTGAYLKVWTYDGQERAAYYMLELHNKYPKTFFGKQETANLNKGLTLHVFGASQPCAPVIGEPTPTPAPAPTDNAKDHIHVQVEPAPCFTPPPTPPGEPIAVPTAATAPQPGPLSTPAGVTPTGRAPAPAASPSAPVASPTAAAATPAAPIAPTAAASPTPAHT